MRHLIKLAGVTVMVTLTNVTVVFAAAGNGNGVAGTTPGNATDVGTKLGHLFSSWGGGVLMGLAGLMGLHALIKRDVGHAATLLALTVILGGFFFAGPTMQNLINGVWSQL